MDAAREAALRAREAHLQRREEELAEQQRVLAEQARLLQRHAGGDDCRRLPATDAARWPPVVPAPAGPSASAADRWTPMRAEPASCSRPLPSRRPRWRRATDSGSACAGHWSATRRRSRNDPESRAYRDLMTSSYTDLLDRITTRRARTGVVGLGYVGLPLAVELGRAGFETIGIDLDNRKVDAINRGDSYIPDVPGHHVAALVRDKRLSATTDFAVVETLDTVNICVPTPLRKTKDPDLSYVVSAVEAIAAYLHPGMLVILESTTYPGTTDEVLLTRARAGRTAGGPRLLPGVLAGARRPGQSDVPDAQRAESGRRVYAGVLEARGGALRDGHRDVSCPSAPRAWRKW